MPEDTNDARDFIDKLNWRMLFGQKKDSSDNVLRADVLVAHMYDVRNDIEFGQRMGQSYAKNQHNHSSSCNSAIQP